MEYNHYRIGTITLVAIGAAIAVAVALVVVVHRRGSMPLGRAMWVAASAVAAAAVLLITLEPSGHGGTYPCTLTMEGPLFSWLRGNQSTANVAMLVPLGVALPLAARGTRWHRWSFAALAAFPVLVEAAQRTLPVGRACDVGDVVDNWFGVAIGCALGWAATSLAARRDARRGPTAR